MTRGSAARAASSEIPTESVAAPHGYRAPQVCSLVGITYRQLDYWVRTGLIKASISATSGSGSQRRFSFTDIIQLKVIKRLLDAGMSLKKIRMAIDILREQLSSESPLADITLLSDGNTIMAAHSVDEVIDAFQRGRGVFGIAVGPVQEELESEIHALFPEPDTQTTSETEVAVPQLGDETPYIAQVTEQLQEMLQGLQADRKAAGESLASLGAPADLAARLLAAVPALSEWDDRVGPFYTSRKVGVLLGGISRQAVAERRHRGSILAMRTADGVWVYPTWQFLDSGEIRPGLREIVAPFTRLDVDGWEIAGWLESTFKEIGGATPRQVFDHGGDLAKLSDMATRAASRLSH